MSRTFHTIVGWWYWALILISSAAMFYYFWVHVTWATIVLALVVILEIEMLIHTRYIVTDDNKLKVESGRFIAKTEMELERIESIRKVRCMAFFEPALSFERCEICYRKKNGQTALVRISPQNPDEFIRWVLKRNPKIQVPGKNV
ncbi:PH domain-containing protein [uncultured Bacteroides sp.]|uniref:PH domain-containing protein n=1 Tax=uncultured Bacteroides sp. TaxID=162156 RepID=UPI00262DA132|nr:PH domain-containing protein [uncultured Bacteroides sp.]